MGAGGFGFLNCSGGQIILASGDRRAMAYFCRRLLIAIQGVPVMRWKSEAQTVCSWMFQMISLHSIFVYLNIFNICIVVMFLDRAIQRCQIIIFLGAKHLE